MIYLVTGTPGTGKTAFVVDMILSNYDGLFKTELEDGTIVDRPIYYCHIDGLDKRAFKATELTEEQIQSAPLDELIPQGSILIVDECDYTYPVRVAGREPPLYIKKLKELRHSGYTLILLTQHPSMIDKYIRQLVGKHIHLERKPIGTKKYEWFRCEENLNAAAFASAVGRFYTPPKRAFKFYKSASKHIQFKKSRHIVFYVFPILLAFLIFRSFSFFENFNNQIHGQNEQIQTSEKNIENQKNNDVSSDIIASSEVSEVSIDDNNLKLEDFDLKIPYMEESKPIYNEVRKVTDFPRIVGCISSDNSCNCYTQQGTKYETTDFVCRKWAEGDRFFDAFKPIEYGKVVMAAENN